MLFRERYWRGIADGSITLAFRRWKRPTVKAGGNLRSPGGYLAIDSVEIIDESSITEADARRAGCDNRGGLLRELDYGPDRALYRIEFHVAGPDPRDALREQADLSADELATIGQRLVRIDAASTDGPWTQRVLEIIAERPATRSAILAKDLGEPDVAWFKTRVRRLKALGLTESLVVGYRLSPRGEAILRSLAG